MMPITVVKVRYEVCIIINCNIIFVLYKLQFIFNFIRVIFIIIKVYGAL
jgi:hypothetical protein